jgi:hypothetical protein
MHLTRPARLSFASIPVLLLAASALRAQEPAPAPAVPTAPSVSFDVAALARDRFRGSLEAMALGRFTVGLSGSYSHTVDQEYSVYPPYDYATMNRPMSYDPYYCAYPESFSCISPYQQSTPRYRAWALDLAIRYYPSVLSFQNGPSRMMVYVGEFVGYHWRTWNEQVVYYYGIGVDDAVQLMAPRDTTIIVMRPDTMPRYPIWPGPNPIRRTLNAIQPGVEFGVRFLPFSRLFIDVGGRFTLVTIEDPTQRVLKGNIESRLVVAGGLVW